MLSWTQTVIIMMISLLYCQLFNGPMAGEI